METGETTLAFTPLKQRETKLIGGVDEANASNNTVDICLNFADVEAAHKVKTMSNFSSLGFWSSCACCFHCLRAYMLLCGYL